MGYEPTLKDVARLSGVSIGTVDRVIHNRGRVAESSRNAVLTAIETLHYHPSQIAQALVNRKSNLKIGVCIPLVEKEFWNEACSGVQTATEQLRPFGVEVITDFIPSYKLVDFQRSVNFLLSQGASGLLLVPAHDAGSCLDDLIPPGIPFATIIEDEPESRRIFHIGVNNYATGRLAGRLMSLYTPAPIRCSVLAANMEMNSTRKRMEGFQDFLDHETTDSSILEVCNIPIDSEKIAYESIYNIAEQQIKAHPDLNAFFVTNGLTQWAAAAVNANQAWHKIRVFGYECTEMTQTYMQKGIIGATIYQMPARQYIRALQLMNQYLNGQLKEKSRLYPADCVVMIKESLPLLNLEYHDEKSKREF